MFHFPPRRLALLVTCCLLVCSVDAQIQQQCANSLVTTTGTQNLARMCGADGGVGACTTTMINKYPNLNHEQYGGPEVAVDGIKATFSVNVMAQFFHTTHIANSWWRVDFGVSRRIQRVQIQNRQDGGTLHRLSGAQIIVGDSTTVSGNLQCGTDLRGNLYDHVVTCDRVGRYLYIFQPRVANIHVSELEAFGPCACPAGQYSPSVNNGPCLHCPTGLTSLEGASSINNCTCSPGAACAALKCPANQFSSEFCLILLQHAQRVPRIPCQQRRAPPSQPASALLAPLRRRTC